MTEFWETSFQEEFGQYGFENFRPITEPAKHMPNAPCLDFLWIECFKK